MASTGTCACHSHTASGSQPAREYLTTDTGHLPGEPRWLLHQRSLTLQFLFTAQGTGGTNGPHPERGQNQPCHPDGEHNDTHSPFPPNPSTEQPFPTPTVQGWRGVGSSFAAQQPQAKIKPAWEQLNTTFAKTAPIQCWAQAGILIVQVWIIKFCIRGTERSHE